MRFRLCVRGSVSCSWVLYFLLYLRPAVNDTPYYMYSCRSTTLYVFFTYFFHRFIFMLQLPCLQLPVAVLCPINSELTTTRTNAGKSLRPSNPVLITGYGWVWTTYGLSVLEPNSLCTSVRHPMSPNTSSTSRGSFLLGCLSPRRTRLFLSNDDRKRACFGIFWYSIVPNLVVQHVRDTTLLSKDSFF